jgi:hypothetical protein
MGQVYDIVKDRRVYSIDVDSTVLEGARFMMEHSIGALPVLRDGEIVGILTRHHEPRGRGRSYAGNYQDCRGDDRESESDQRRRNHRELPVPDARIWLPTFADYGWQTAEGLGVIAGHPSALRRAKRIRCPPRRQLSK